MPHISMTDFTSGTKSVKDSNETATVQKKKGISAHLALINFLKGMIGPGCFSLPLAFRQAGLWTGFALVFIIGLFTCICMDKIVRCSQFLSSRNKKVKSLNYGEMVGESFKQSFPFLRRYRHLARHFVDLCLSSFVLGICSVFFIFVVDHAREIIGRIWPQMNLSKLLYMVLALVPFELIALVRSVRLMSYISLAGNICMLFSIAIIFSQLLTAKHVINEIPWFTSAQGVIMATGAVIYSFEGQALVLPLTNKMEHPSEMRGWTGVLTTGIVLVTAVYAGCGFYGYITYGENVKESITLNMDQSPLNLTMKALLALVLYTGYLLQLYSLTTSLRPLVLRLVQRKSAGDSRMTTIIVDYGLRSGIVFISFLLAVAVPNLENLIPLIGITSGMLLALVIPPLADIATFLPVLLEEKRFCQIVLLISNNLFFCAIGIFFLVSGLETNLRRLFS
ncbi:hypothetical protein V3C99_007828 [Haemonchus contortus]